MHRSGTSATARVLAALGLSLGGEDGLMEANPANPEGFFERTRLTVANHEILRDNGSHWLAPPANGVSLAANRLADLRQVFRTEISGDNFIWKDPVCCFTARLWIEAIEDKNPVFVIPLRPPAVVVDSLVRRGDPITRDVGLAAWESYCCAAVNSASGSPTYFLDYDELLTETRPVVEDLQSFLGSHGYEATDVESGIQGVHRSLRHSADSGAELTISQGALWSEMRSLIGPQNSFSRSNLLSASDDALSMLDAIRPILIRWEDDVLDIRRRLLEVGDHLGEARKLIPEVDRLRSELLAKGDELSLHVSMVDELRVEVLGLGDRLHAYQVELADLKAQS